MPYMDWADQNVALFYAIAMPLVGLVMVSVTAIVERFWK